MSHVLLFVCDRSALSRILDISGRDAERTGSARSVEENVDALLEGDSISPSSSTRRSPARFAVCVLP